MLFDLTGEVIQAYLTIPGMCIDLATDGQEFRENSIATTVVIDNF